MSEPHNKDDEAAGPAEYGGGTLIAAGLIFVGFALLLYFLPTIMTAIGGDNPWVAGAAIGAVLVLPFLGLWLRGRRQRSNRSSGA